MNIEQRGYVSIINIVLVSITIALIAWFGFTITRTPCNQQLHYRIGELDNRFELSQDQFTSVLLDAENIWEQPTGLDLFVYDPEAEFTVNLVFDERQANFLEKQALERDIDTGAEDFKKVEEEFLSKKSVYDTAVANLTQEINYWNSQGGAPAEEFERLESERMRINGLASELNILAKRYNALADELNIRIEEFNLDVGRIFDQGEYTGEEINIYQFETTKDLRVVLAHEFGHALTIDHLNNPQSIMYHLMQEQDLDSPHLTQEDVDALHQVCANKNNFFTQLFDGSN